MLPPGARHSFGAVRPGFMAQYVHVYIVNVLPYTIGYIVAASIQHWALWTA